MKNPTLTLWLIGLAKEKLKIKKGIASVAMRCLPNVMRVVELWLKLWENQRKKIVTSSTMHLQLLLLFVSKMWFFFGALSLRKGALKKKYFALDYYDLKNITKTVPLFQMSWRNSHRRHPSIAFIFNQQCRVELGGRHKLMGHFSNTFLN